MKQSGASPLEKCREGLRELKKQIVGVIAERKHVSSSIDAIREKKASQDEAIKKQKAAVGRFTSNESIDEEIRRIEDYMAHNSINLKEEKDCMLQIKELNKKRDEVKHLEVMEGKRGDGAQAMSLPDLFEARKTVDAKLDVLRAQEKEQVEAMNALREKSQNKESSERFEKLLAERKVIRDKISESIGQIREMRKEFGEADDKWFEHDRLIKNLKWQIRQKNIKDREANQAKYEEEKKEKQAAWEAEKEYRNNFDEDGNPREKFMDFDLAERITLCEQLVTFLKKYMPQEETSAPAAAEQKDGRQVEKPTGVVAFSRNSAMEEDALGLNAFMVDEVVSKKSKKKDKKKKANAAKNDEMLLVAEGEVVTLQMSLEMIQQFASMGLAVPVNSEDCEGSVKQLLEKKVYYEAKGEEGLTLKDVIKAEKDGRKKGGAPKKEEKAEAKKEEAPKEFDLAAARASAQGKQMTDEEKKARGLLYDTSKASAVRDESEDDEEDEDCDMTGGDPFEGL